MFSSPETAAYERRIILLVALIQFVNILDFMMVMPLGPDLAVALGMPASDVGLIGGAYVFAAAISGLVAALFLDAFSRRRATLFCLAGLVIATIAAAWAWDKESMLAIRLLAGVFGGPLTSLGQALIADTIPVERRGRAMGKVAGAFAAASVLGVPFGLELAQHFSWHAPFLVTGVLGMMVGVLAFFYLPYRAPAPENSELSSRIAGLVRMMRSPLPLISYLGMSLVMLSGFMIVPNIAAHLQLNLDYPREKMGLLYLCGGALSFFGMRGAGWLVDKTSAARTSLVFTGLLILALGLGFVWYPSPIPVLVLFILFMVATSGRMVTAHTLLSRVPPAHERGAYMSLQSTVTHFSSALGAYYASHVLVESEGKLLHMPMVGATSIGLSLCIPIIFWYVERQLSKQPFARQELG